MKPSWKDAPDWANYVAMDTDKSWWWFENEPSYCDNEWDGVGRSDLAYYPPAARRSLEVRPNEI